MEKLQENKGKIAAGIIAAALLTAIPFIGDHEGEKLTSYEDVAGVWTICEGVTSHIKPGMHLTEEECGQLNNSTIGNFMQQVVTKLTVSLPPKTLASHTSFAYNIGINGYSHSKTLRLTNSGHLEDGCRAMMNWHIADDKDCRIKENGCYGIVQRRNDEINLCLAGLK